jgi:regulator of sigma E protease
MDILIQAAQLILSLSILVTLHELGHFIPARLFKTRVEKFYLFFNPWFSIAKKQIGETVWGIGWLPLGGYVKIAGMVDESMDKEQMAKPAEPWEFRSKPAWQRLIIMLGGVTVNLILGIFIYILLVFNYGESKLAPKDVNGGFAVSPVLQKYGFKTGDIVLKSEGIPVEDADDVNKFIMLRGARNFEVMHADGKTENLTLPDDVEYSLFSQGIMQPFSFRFKSTGIDSLLPQSTAEGILKKGDQLVTIGEYPIEYFDNTIEALYNYRGKAVDFTFTRNNDTLTKKIKVKEDGTIGFKPSADRLIQDTTKVKEFKYSVAQSISKGTAFGIHTLKDYASQLKFIFTKKGATSVGGFASIGKLFAPTWDWQVFWERTALISIILAFMNILPIPALDGGHVVFLIYEIVTGREAPQKVLEYAQYVGFFLLMGLMLYANGNDIYKAIFGG